MPTSEILQIKAPTKPANKSQSYLGILGGAHMVAIQQDGTVSLDALHDRATGQVSKSIQWAVKAHDRTYAAANEPSVRQRRDEFAPVVETRLRVSNGDIRQTAYVAATSPAGLSATSQATIIEFSNDSPLAVGLVILVDAKPEEAQTESTGECVVLVEDKVIRFSQKPQKIWTANDFEIAEWLEGDTVDAPQAELSKTAIGPDQNRGSTKTAIVFPLPHKTKLRLAISELTPQSQAMSGQAEQKSATTAWLTSLPSPEAVTSGWRKSFSALASFEFPDHNITKRFNQNRVRLGLGSKAAEGFWRFDKDSVAVLEALALTGDKPAIKELIGSTLDLNRDFGVEVKQATPELMARWLIALARALTLIGSSETALALLEPSVLVVDACHTQKEGSAIVRSWASKKRKVVTASRESGLATQALAQISRIANQTESATYLLLQSLKVEDDAQVTTSINGGSLLETMSATNVDDDLNLATEYISAGRNLLIADGFEETSEGFQEYIKVLPNPDSSWKGVDFQCGSLPCFSGLFSFAVRWHGYRPAVFWELERVSPSMGQVEISCSSFDSSWRSFELSGEALLEGSPQPLPAAPTEGQSFA